MSELKAYKMVNAQYLTDCPCVIPADVYAKFEVDAVIAKLEKNLSEIQSQKMQLEDDIALLRRNNTELRDKLRHYPMMAALIDSGNKEIRHLKYKRCLAMEKRCEDKIDNPVQCDEHDDWLIITEYWERWHKRWLELAKKFKEAK